MKKHTLQAHIRKELGKKVSQLRKNGMLPSNVFGNKIPSVSVVVKRDDFTKVYKEAGETGLIELTVDAKVRPVLVHNVQVDPVSYEPLHVEFLQVDLKEKVKAHVPLRLIGEAPAVTQKIGVVLTLLDEVDVEALPTELPEHIDIDISVLAEADAEIAVSQLSIPAGVEVVTDADVIVARIAPIVTKEAEEQAASDEIQAQEAKAESAPAEGEPVPTPEDTTS